MAKYNDLDMSCWKQYDDIYTDTLWIIDKRDNSGAHSGAYHGNFVPQIPNQLFRRYTKKGDWILDPFMGSGTSLIEAQRLGRNSIGIELQEEVAKDAYQRIFSEKNNCCHGARMCWRQQNNRHFRNFEKRKRQQSSIRDFSPAILGYN